MRALLVEKRERHVVFHLIESFPFRIGRSPGCDFPSQADDLAEIRQAGDGFYVLACDGTRQVAVNGLLAESHPVADGDVLLVGATRFEFRVLEIGDSAERSTPRQSPARRACLLALSAAPRTAFCMVSPVALVGSAPGCDLIVQGPGVSGHHAVVRREGDSKYVIYDFASENGVWVNGLSGQSHTLADGDRILLGEMEFAFIQL